MGREVLLVDDKNYEEFLRNEKAVLVLSRSTCESCAEYLSGLGPLMDSPDLSGVAFGKIVLDRPGSINIKKTNTWIAELEFLPHTVLFRQGRIVDEFDASNPSYLEERVREFLLA
jgi:hypothetical protein